MVGLFLLWAAMLGAAMPMQLAGKNASSSAHKHVRAKVDLGVPVDAVSPRIENPYAAFAFVKRAVYEGEEMEPDTGETVKSRTESVVHDAPGTIAGMKVTVVEVSDFDDGVLVEKTKDYYAQDASGTVYYIGEDVDDYENGKVAGHGGQWMAGRKGARAGVFMPASPKVGDVFEQERAPGVAEDRTKVIATGQTVKVRAGTFENCIETEDFDPISKTTQRKMYCPGVGLVREVFGSGGSVELIEVENR